MHPRPEDIHLVSPWAPSGVAWLLNALLELGVPIFRDQSRPTWIPDGSAFRLSPHEDDLKRHLPSLTRLDRITFRTDVRVRWSHEWPQGHNQRAPIIFCVRHAGDALYSLHRRFHAATPLSQFLASPSTPMFAPPEFQPGLTPADTWALFTRLWLDTMPGRVLLVRFEDLKRDPVRSLRPIARVLGLNPTTAELAAAAEHSAFEKARDAEQKFIAENPAKDQFRANHSGRLDESSAAFTPRDWRTLTGLPTAVLRSTNYAPPPHASPDTPTPRPPLTCRALEWLECNPAAGVEEFTAFLSRDPLAEPRPTPNDASTADPVTSAHTDTGSPTNARKSPRASVRSIAHASAGATAGTIASPRDDSDSASRVLHGCLAAARWTSQLVPATLPHHRRAHLRALLPITPALAHPQSAPASLERAAASLG